MKRLINAIFLLNLSVILALSGCQSQKTKAVEGAVIGGIIGAGAGGIIGHQSHHGAEGAAIGAAIGALSGAAIGSQMPNQNVQGATSGNAAVNNPNQMSQQSIIDLAKQGAADAVIIDRIRLNNSKFTLTPEEVANLKNQGVSDAVIQAMQGN